MLDPADWLRVLGGLDVLVEERQLADVEGLHLGPPGSNLLCGAQQPLIEGTLPQAARYGEDSKRFSFHCSSPVSVWSSRLRSTPLRMQPACGSVARSPLW